MNEPYLIAFKDLMEHEGDVFIEFREIPNVNRHCDSARTALWWSERLCHHHQLKNGLDCRFWSGEPTKEQMEQTGWETDAVKEAKTE